MENHKDFIVQNETFGCHTCQYSCNYADPIAKGAFGIVYEATIANRGDFLGAELVAVKVTHLDRRSKLFADRTKWSKLRQRLQNLPEFNHDHLVKYHKVTIAKGSRGGASIELMMDYHTGEDLRTVIRNLRQQGALLSEAEAVSYTIQIAEGLQFLHDNQLIHGDLKPCNILTMQFENGDRKLAICDLDDIVQMERDTTCSHDVTHLRGTYRYMSPEMLKKFAQLESENPGRKTDMWSLGCIMLELADCVVGNDHKWLRKEQEKIEAGNKITDERFIRLIIDGYVPCAIETTASCLTARAQQCLHSVGSERISASSLIQHLKAKELVMIFQRTAFSGVDCYLFDPSTQTMTELALPMDLTEVDSFYNVITVSKGSVLYQRTKVSGALTRTDLDQEVMEWDVQNQTPPTVLCHHSMKPVYSPIAVMDKIYFWYKHESDALHLHTLDLRAGKHKILKQLLKPSHPDTWDLYRARDGNRIIFIIYDWLKKMSKRVECYDTVTGEWESLPDLPGWRLDFAMVVLQKTVYVLGGYDFDTLSPSRSCLRLDLQSPTRQWETMRDLLEGREGHCAFVSDNMIYAAGGLDGKATASTIMEVYDTKRDLWSAVSVKGSSRFFDGKYRRFKAFNITLSWPVSGLSQ